VVEVTTLLALSLVATCYPHTGPLYCGGTMDASVPIVALPYQEYGDTWECGDLVYLRFEDGSTLMARAMDTGPFGDNCVIVGDECVPIAVDVPRAFWPLGDRLSAGVELWNFGGMAREMGIE